MEEWKTRESAFIGKLTAGATHELRNVLAIIGESAGLVEDILRLKGLDNRVESKLSLIREQISRGQTILSALNRFAHSGDHLIHTLDVKQSLEDLMVLSRRFLRQKNIECLMTHADEVIIKTYPTKWNMLHFAVLMSIVDDMPADETIELSCHREEKGVAVKFRLPSGNSPEFGALRRLLDDPAFRDVMVRIRGRVEVGDYDVRVLTGEVDV